MGLLRIEGISKQYEDRIVLDRVDLEVEPGEVLALVGRNGAGKSTLAGILAGSVTRDGGEVYLNGVEVRPASPQEARDAGIGIIEQRFRLDPNLRVAEALFRHTHVHSLPYSVQRGKARRLLIQAGIALDPDALLGDLPRSDVGLVETVRLLADRREVVVVDEVAEDFNPRELDELRYVLDQLTAAGQSVIYITHHLADALRIADRVAVLRDGRIQCVADSSGLRVEDLNEAIFGERLAEYHRAWRDFADVEVVLSMRGLRPDGARAAVGLELRAGEVLGLLSDHKGGLYQLLGAITGDQPAYADAVEVWGQGHPIQHPRDAVAARIAYLPIEDDPLGVSFDLGLARAMLLGESLDESGYGASMAEVSSLLALMPGAVAAADAPSAVLSGGQNQLRRLRHLLTAEQRIVVLNEPTRGLDLASRGVFGEILEKFTDAGGAVLLVATDPQELLHYTDRVAVWTDRAIRAVWATDELDAEDLVGIVDRLEEVSCLDPVDALVRPFVQLSTPPGWRDTPGRRVDLTLAG